MATTGSASPGHNIEGRPRSFTFLYRHTALLLLNTQKDFVYEDGYARTLNADVSAVESAIKSLRMLLRQCRDAGLTIVHAKECYAPDLSDCPSSKLNVYGSSIVLSKSSARTVGDTGPLGRFLIRGEPMSDFVNELRPIPGEIIIEKKGAGAFWNTELLHKLKANGITRLLLAGITTEGSLTTTLREASDRGFECCTIVDCTASYDAQLKQSALDVIRYYGLCGVVTEMGSLLPALVQDALSLKGRDERYRQISGCRIRRLQAAYRSGVSPETVMEQLYCKIEEYKEHSSAVWIHLVSKDSVLRQAQAVQAKWPNPKERPPLFGIPFSVKDSIDVAGLPTTTACPPMAHVPSTSAPVYDKIIDSGGIFIGKTNMDQIATGLTGCRSPYGIPHSTYSKDYTSGGSSSGSAVSVGAGLVSFSIGTDTAGSGRVPALYNDVVGYKPTRGLVSMRGITPACLSLDCIAVFARTVSEARTVWQVLEGYDPQDRYSKPPCTHERHVEASGPRQKSFRFGVPPPEALGACHPLYRKIFSHVIRKLMSIGGILRPIDWAPFDKAGKLLYDGTLVNERLANLPDDWLDRNRSHLHPTIVELMDKVVARQGTAVELFRDLQARELYTRQAAQVFSADSSGVDVVVTPTAPIHWTIEEVVADPIRKNSVLGEYTHCANVLDLCAISVPVGTFPLSDYLGKPDAEGSLPFGVQFASGSRNDAELLEIARRFEASIQVGNTEGKIRGGSSNKGTPEDGLSEVE
ncbi:amidase signature domain-containing protein [Phyllosticta citribraziliensis]|uniref:Amidase signature domain-containing protein n=1 Tax=Phyllosticta citribraziliensis TaxID=989973 RepID=A0ABR1L817_9PEZI